jgi:hypothetical protein
VAEILEQRRFKGNLQFYVHWAGSLQASPP